MGTRTLPRIAQTTSTHTRRDALILAIILALVLVSEVLFEWFDLLYVLFHAAPVPPSSEEWLAYVSLVCIAGMIFSVRRLHDAHHEAARRATAEQESMRVYCAAQQEIAERVLTETRLRESENRYRSLVEASPDGILVHRDGQTLYANATYETIVGIPVTDLLGMNIHEMTRPPLFEIARACIRRTDEAQHIAGLHPVQFVRLDGETHDLEIIRTPIMYDGAPATQVVLRDMTAQNAARKQLRLLQSVAINTDDSVMIADTGNPFGKNLRILYVNDALVQMTGYSREEIIGKGPRLFFGLNSDTTMLATVEESLANKEPISVEMIEYRKDGTSFWAEIRLFPVLDDDGSCTHFVALQRDITERRKMIDDLRTSEQRYRQMFENHQAMGWIINPTTGAIIDANPAACAFYGYTREELTAMHVGDLVVSATSDPSTSHTYTDPHAYSTFRHRLASGEMRDVEVRSAPVEVGNETLLYFIIHDITERKRMEEQLVRNALHDSLTGLPNRTLFMDRLQQSLGRTRQHPDRMCAVLYLDFDRFKNINDSLGHIYGDDFLVKAAQRLTNCVRPQDTIARLGGDEFALLIDGITETNEATSYAECIQNALTMPIIVRGHEIFVTASIGIALCDHTHRRPEGVLRDADTAMYRAKASGRGRYVVFDAAMHAHAVALLQMETDLRHALERREFIVHYQPIVTLDTGHIAGFEALIRWRHPRLGMVSPEDFIPLAEETGMIVALDRWIMGEACKQMRQWEIDFPTHADLTMSVNVSGRQFAEPDTLPHILATIRNTGVEPRHIKIEITESSLIAHADTASSVLQMLHAWGICTRLDDFGVGYSSLNYLRRFPIEAVKIDRSFISGDEVGSEHAAIVRAITALANDLNISVVAEGIENEAQVRWLRTLACQYGQGYYFSLPVNAETATMLLQQEPNVLRKPLPAPRLAPVVSLTSPPHTVAAPRVRAMP